MVAFSGLAGLRATERQAALHSPYGATTSEAALPGLRAIKALVDLCRTA